MPIIRALVLSIIAIITLASPALSTCGFQFTGGTCLTFEGIRCFSVYFLVMDTSCEVDIYRTSSTTCTGWVLLADNWPSDTFYYDCPDWSTGALYDYRLVLHTSEGLVIENRMFERVNCYQ